MSNKDTNNNEEQETNILNPLVESMCKKVCK